MGKICARCNETKGQNEFNRDKRKLDGLQAYCRQCNAKYQAERRLSDPTKYREERRRSYFKHHGARKARAAEYYLEVRERRLAYLSDWRGCNRNLARELVAEWRKNNPHKTGEYAAARRSRLLLAAVPLSSEHRQAIADIYAEAHRRRRAGESCHVDHIVPLKAKAACGLHVPWNLEIVPSDVNLGKGNKFAPGFFKNMPKTPFAA